MDGMSYRDIARYLQTTIPAVKRSIEKYLEETTAETSQATRETLRRREDARLDALLHPVWQKAMDADHPEHLPAVRTALAIADRRAKLHGLDAPTELIVHNPTVAEIDRWVAGVVTKAAGHGVTEAEVIDADIIDDDTQDEEEDDEDEPSFHALEA